MGREIIATVFQTDPAGVQLFPTLPQQAAVSPAFASHTETSQAATRVRVITDIFSQRVPEPPFIGHSDGTVSSSFSMETCAKLELPISQFFIAPRSVD
jgi:hypothetical protein